LLLVTTLMACQKDSLSEMKSNANQVVETEKKVPNPADIESIEVIRLSLKEHIARGASSRNKTKVIYHDTLDVFQGGAIDFSYLKMDLPDPNQQKLKVEVKPLNGDPDVYLYAHNWFTSHKRYVRGSMLGMGQTDETTFRSTCMKAKEEEMCVQIYGYSATKFSVTITLVPVECQELPTAEQHVTADISPVCGCDGQEYFNASSATAAGLTSYVNSPCLKVLPSFTYINRVVPAYGDLSVIVIDYDNTEIEVFQRQQGLSEDDSDIIDHDVSWGKIDFSTIGDKYQATYIVDLKYHILLFDRSANETDPIEVTYLVQGENDEIRIKQKYTFDRLIL
ncbi:MAG: hypothetical protein AAGJ18_04755, partial [Bacteroidota bacterium]